MPLHQCIAPCLHHPACNNPYPSLWKQGPGLEKVPLAFVPRPQDPTPVELPPALPYSSGGAAVRTTAVFSDLASSLVHLPRADVRLAGGRMESSLAGRHLGLADAQKATPLRLERSTLTGRLAEEWITTLPASRLAPDHVLPVAPEVASFAASLPSLAPVSLCTPCTSGPCTLVAPPAHHPPWRSNKGFSGKLPGCLSSTSGGGEVRQGG